MSEVTAVPSESPAPVKTAPLWPFAAASLGLAVVALLAAGLLAPGLRGVSRGGILAAAAGAAVALGSLRFGLPRGTNGMLAGFSAGFFARMVCVAVGLIASGARGAAALTWAFSFFALYAGTQGVEIAYVFASSRAARAPGPVRSGP